MYPKISQSPDLHRGLEALPTCSTPSSYRLLGLVKDPEEYISPMSNLVLASAFFRGPELTQGVFQLSINALEATLNSGLT